MKPIDTNDLNPEWMAQGEPETRQDLSDALAELRLLAIRLDLKVVGALVKSAIAMIPITTH